MVKNLDLKIQMILESRVSLEDASVIFSIPREELAAMADKYRSTLSSNLQVALQYLFYYEATYYKEKEKKKSRFIAKAWLTRYLNLCRIEDRREQSQALIKFKKSFIDEKVKDFPTRDKRTLTSSERESLIRYQLKYGVNNTDMSEVFRVNHNCYLAWTSNIKDVSLKRRYELLNEYWTIIYEKKLIEGGKKGRS